MISGKLIKNLEMYGFELQFPAYKSIEDMIASILKEKNRRLYLAIPLILHDKFDYDKTIKNLNRNEIKEFNKIIAITKKIFKIKGIDAAHLRKKARYSKKEFDYFYGSFKEFMKNKEKKETSFLEESIELRGKLGLNKALSIIFKPGKRRTMEKIFQHEKLTNSELKYYYRSIRPAIKTILDNDLQKYVKIIEETKKVVEK